MNHLEKYTSFLRQIAPLRAAHRIVVDASNGPGGIEARELFKNGSIQAIFINDTIDPDFGAHGPNPLADNASRDCTEAVIREKAELGVIFDADADRAVFVDGKGRIVPGYKIALLLSQGVTDPIVADELIFNILTLLNVANITSSPVGSLFIKKTMRAHNAELGLEDSGHYYFRDFFFADGGLISLLYLLKKLEMLGVSLADFCDSCPQVFVERKNIKTTMLWSGVEAAMKKLFLDITPATRDGVTYTKHGVTVNVRPSNTEPLLRIVTSGLSQEDTTQLLAKTLQYLS